MRTKISRQTVKPSFEKIKQHHQNFRGAHQIKSGAKNRTANAITDVLGSIGVASIIGFAAIINSAIALIYQITLARVLSPNEFGLLASIFALVTTLATLSNFGINNLWIKAFTESFAQAKKLLFGSYVIVTTTATIAIVSVAIASAHVDHLAANKQVTALISLMIFSQAFIELLIARYQVERREHTVAFAMTVQNASRLCVLCISWIIKQKIDINDIAAAHAISSAIVLTVAVYGLKSFSVNGCWLELPKGAVDQALNLKETVKSATPFGAAALFQMLYYQSDLVMLPIFSSTKEAGLYGAAFVLTGASFVLPNAIINRFFMTRIHLWSSENPQNLKRFVKFGTLSFAAAGLVSAVILTVFAVQLLGLIFGPQYTEASEIQAVLAASIPIMFASYVLGSIITTRGFMPRKTKILAFVSIFNIVANVLMIPRFGAVGAAWTTVGSSILIFILYAITTGAILKGLPRNA